MELTLIIFILFIVLSVLGLVCAIGAFISNSKLKKEYENVVGNYQRLKMQYDTLKHDRDVLSKENKQLKIELDAERKVIASNNITSVEELPKTEKVAKPRGRKPKATK